MRRETPIGEVALKEAWSMCLGLLLATSTTASGTTLRVPSAFSSIQSAINACVVGDTVLVSQGTYYETLVIPLRIALISEEGSDVTTIDGSSQGPVIFIAIGGEGTVVSGFRVRNGNATSGAHAGGIHADVDIGVGGRVVVRNNIVEYNRSLGWVGGVFAVRASTVEDNVIQFNNRSAGKATSALEASGIVRRNLIRYNGDLGELQIVSIHNSDTGPSTVESNVIVDNASPVIAVAIISGHSGAVVRHNTIANNGCGGQATLEIEGTGDFEFTHNIVSHVCEGLSCDFRGGAYRM